MSKIAMLPFLCDAFFDRLPMLFSSSLHKKGRSCTGVPPLSQLCCQEKLNVFCVAAGAVCIGVVVVSPHEPEMQRA